MGDEEKRFKSKTVTDNGVSFVYRGEGEELRDVVVNDCDVHIEHMGENCWRVAIDKNGERHVFKFFNADDIVQLGYKKGMD